jgi:transcriptional regulator with XRE-family HTH domain
MGDMKVDQENNLRRRIIGEYLKKKREKKQLTQWDVARTLEYTTAQFVSNWERGVSLPPMEALPKLASLLKVPSKEFVDVMLKYQEEVLKQQKKQMQSLFRAARN